MQGWVVTVLRRLHPVVRRRPLLAALAGATALFFFAYPLVDAWLRGLGVAPGFVFWDFGAYGGAVRRWEAGEAVYLTNDSGGYHGRYLYPPFVLLLFWPFTRLGYPWAATAWGVVSVAILWRGLVAAIRTAGYDPRGVEQAAILWLLCGFQPLLLSLKMGQTAGFLAGALCLAYAALGGEAADARGPSDFESEGRVRSSLSGALTAAVCLFKLPYAPAAAHLLADRDRLLGGVAAGAGLVALSVAVFGVETNLAYLDVLRWGLGTGGAARSPTLWLPPYYRPFYYVASSSLAIQAAASVAIAALAVLAPEDAESEVFALGVAAVPLLAPKTYAYYLVALLPAAAILLVRERRRDGRPGVPILALLLSNVHSYGLKLLVDLGPRLGGYEAAWETALPLLQPGLWANVLLVGFAAWRVCQRVTVAGWRAQARRAAVSLLG